jgi:phosphate starvation-inducible PhoH-like protein
MKRITVPEEGIETLFGSYDENLKHLESLFNVRIRTHGHELLVDGDPPGLEKIDRIVGQLSSLMRDGFKLSNADVKTAAALLAQDESVDLRDHFLKGSLTAAGRRRVAPKTVTQRRYLEAIEQNDIVFGIGPAGTGKTYLAMAQAVAFLAAKKVSRIILARPAVEAGEKLGFLPGDLQEKVNPYLRPLYDALYDMLDVERVGRYIERGTIEIAPIAFMRGRTLNDSFVILDEAQNTTSEQMKMFLTRLGFGAKAVITGDITQIDLPSGRTSGLIEAMKVVGGVEGIAFIRFDERDVVRHKLVQQIVKAYEAYSNGNGRAPLGVPENTRTEPSTAVHQGQSDPEPIRGVGSSGRRESFGARPSADPERGEPIEPRPSARSGRGEPVEPRGSS